jgi:HK97 family phage major capsid protein
MTTFDVSGPLPTVEQLEADYFEKQLAELEGRRDAAQVKARKDADWERRLKAGLDDMQEIKHSLPENASRFAAGFIRFLRTGDPTIELPGPDGRLESKAAIVQDSTGEILVPAQMELDIRDLARTTGTIRSLADVRPTTQSKQHATLLGPASTGWGKLETGTSATDAGIVPATTAPDPIPVFDLVSLALIGFDELDDAPATAQASIVDAISSAIVDAEDTAFANGTGSGQPSGLALAANVALVPAGQKVAVATTNTPTWAQLQTIPWLLPTRYRNNASWLLHPTSAKLIAALTDASGMLVWPDPGPGGKGLLGWPTYMVDGLPDPAVAGTGDASVWFADVRSAYRIADRGRTTVTVLRQRYADQGYVGLIVRHRVGGDLLRGSACCIYTQ